MAQDYSAEEERDYRDSVKVFDEVIGKLRNVMKADLDKISTDSVWYKETSERVASLFHRELKALMISDTPEARNVVNMVYNHIVGDVLMKAHQLSTLEKLTESYINNEMSFQWFINSFYPVIAGDIKSNAYILVSSLFHTAQTRDNRPVVRPPVGRRNNNSIFDFVGLTPAEFGIGSTTEATEMSLSYLILRPWLTGYLTAILFYRRKVSIENYSELINYVKMINEKPAVEPEALDPDSLSTAIPVPSWDHIVEGSKPNIQGFTGTSTSTTFSATGDAGKAPSPYLNDIVTR